MTEIVTRRRATMAPAALILGLALVVSGCAGSGSKLANPDDLYDTYDTDNDNNLSQEEWDQAYWRMDANGDGFVSHDEFNAAFAGGPGGP